ncbi:MAG: hypothetical protein GY938_00555 [Ketobacter sp.]|nr:hypothetical protein [Ketobacter sp.]
MNDIDKKIEICIQQLEERIGELEHKLRRAKGGGKQLRGRISELEHLENGDRFVSMRYRIEELEAVVDRLASSERFPYTECSRLRPDSADRLARIEYAKKHSKATGFEGEL